jgi:N-acetylglucosamine-6-sulfatase
MLPAPSLAGLSTLLLLAALAGAAAAPPNVVWILADDLDRGFDQDRLALMPNLRTRVRDLGVHFSNHVAAQPVCGPSRSSLLAGRYPHNVGYFANLDTQSVATWKAEMNNTVGSWATAAGYHTAFFGKYVNGVEKTVSAGWTHWGAYSTSANTYNYFNNSLWNVTFDDSGVNPISDIATVSFTGTHQADVLPVLFREQAAIAIAKARPFFIHLTPTMVHEGTCYGPYASDASYARDDPYWEKNLTGFGCDDGGSSKENNGCAITISPCTTLRHRHSADGLVNPHVPSFNTTSSGVLPAWMQTHWPALSGYESARQDAGFRNRTGSVMDLDDLIGGVLDTLDELGVANNTYVIFTADNGFHLGEHRMLFGKQHPYETDVRLPFYMRGPGVARNETLLHPTTLIDITATVVELTGATPVGPPLDGKSLVAELGGGTDPALWRSFSFTEHFMNELTWWQIRRPLDPTPTTFAWWCTGALSGISGDGKAAQIAFEGSAEAYDISVDEWQLRNRLSPAAADGFALSNASLPLGIFLSQCGGAACSAPLAAAFTASPLQCKTTNGHLQGEEWRVDP